MVLLHSKEGLLGTSAHDFNLPGIDGQDHSLESFSEAKILVLVFMCNHCPYVLAVLDRLNDLSAAFKDRGVQFIGINPNDAVNYPDDSFENMKNLPIKFPYLRDESQVVAKEYQAVCTPDIFVYDPDRKLVYHGRIDDSWDDASAVTKRDLAEALETILSGGSVPEEEQEGSMGCSIKWK